MVEVHARAKRYLSQALFLEQRLHHILAQVGHDFGRRLDRALLLPLLLLGGVLVRNQEQGDVLCACLGEIFQDFSEAAGRLHVFVVDIQQLEAAGISQGLIARRHFLRVACDAQEDTVIVEIQPIQCVERGVHSDRFSFHL